MTTIPLMKCVRPATYEWYDNGDDFCGWIIRKPALYVFDDEHATLGE